MSDQEKITFGCSSDPSLRMHRLDFTHGTVQEIDSSTPPKGYERRSIYSPIGQRVLGFVLIAQGLVTLVLGARAPRWQMAFVRWGARRNGQRKLRHATRRAA